MYRVRDLGKWQLGERWQVVGEKGAPNRGAFGAFIKEGDKHQHVVRRSRARHADALRGWVTKGVSVTVTPRLLHGYPITTDSMAS